MSAEDRNLGQAGEGHVPPADPSADGNGRLDRELVEQWRENAYNCYSTGHKF